MKITNHLRRVLAATMFGLGCHTAALHAQNIMLRIDAPQGTDAQTLAADIGTLKITFSNSKDFFDTSLYAANTLDFGSDYYNNGKDSYHHYFSRELTLNADDGNGNAWWGNTNKVWLNFETVRRQVSGRTGQPIYYRIYNPHFSRIITGQIDPTDADEVTLHHTELTQARRVAFMPPVDRDGNAVPAILAPDLRTGACSNFSTGRVNMHDLTEPFARYVYKGDTLRYLVAPESSELALHADSIVVTDTTTCVTTDYRKAVECRFYITDSQGQLCPVTNGELSSVYYSSKRGRGYGDYNCSIPFKLTAPDGTHAAYALPGQQIFQLHYPKVQTTDPDFLMPYNADLGYILGEVTIPASTEPVSLSIAKSKPLRVTTTLADAAPYADHLQFSAHTYVNPPYSWQENKQMSVECKEVSRQIKGSDLVVTTLVEGSTYPILALNAQYGAQSDTIASVLSRYCSLYSDPFDPRTEFSLTYKNFYDGHFNTLPAFSQLHPVKFVVPCHQFQTGRVLNLFGKYGQADDRVAELAGHHDGCAKQLQPGSADPIPYDTITIILPEGEYDWVMQKDLDEYNSAPHHAFTLANTDTLVQRLQPTDFALLRVSCLGADSIYVYNKVPAWHHYCQSKLDRQNKYDYTNGRLYYADEEIPLSPGYNERTITWREVKLQKDTLYSLSCWFEAPITYVDEDGSYYTSYGRFDRPYNYLRLEKLETATADSAICISTGSRANLAVWSGGTFAPARFFTISPSEADTTVTVYTQKTVRVNFGCKNRLVQAFERLNMCYGNEQTHIVPNSNFYRRNRMDLEPGHYTMSGVVANEDDATGEYVLTPFSIAFDIEAGHSAFIELCPDPTAVAAAPANSAPAKAAACYTPDGRRISTPQPGLNIIKMTDGSVRKVIVK